MKRTLTFAAAVSLAGSAALADQRYPYEVERDGVLLNCEANATVVNGKKTRRCIVAGGRGEGAAGQFLGAGISATTVAVSVGVIGVIGAVAAGNDDGDSTTGTND